MRGSAGDSQIADVVAEAFAATEFAPGRSAGAVAPLQELIAAHGLVVEERPCLTRGSAAAYLAAEFGRQPAIEGDPEERLSGFLFANIAGGWILASQDPQNPVVRRRFTIAHEFGHYLLHFLPRLAYENSLQFREARGIAGDSEDETSSAATVAVVASDAENVPAQPALEEMEEEANRFAAAVLMPEVVCRAWVDRLSPRYGGHAEPLARRLAADFLVSQTAMQRRLRDLGLL